jgi:hypothetical protein
MLFGNNLSSTSTLSSSLSSSYNDIESLDENVFYENEETTTRPRLTQIQLRKILNKKRSKQHFEVREEAIVSAQSSSSSQEDIVNNLIDEIDQELLKNYSNSSSPNRCSSQSFHYKTRINICSCKSKCNCSCHMRSSSNQSNSLSSSSLSSLKNTRISTSLSPTSRHLFNNFKKRHHFGSFESLDWDISFDLNNNKTNNKELVSDDSNNNNGSNEMRRSKSLMMKRGFCF